MKYCKACGKPMHETAAHCPHCGAVQNNVPAPSSSQAAASTAYAPSLMAVAVVGVILGIFPLLAFFTTPVWTRSHALGSAVFAVAALVLGCISTAKQHRARGVGIAAVVLAVIGMLMALISVQPD